MICPPTSTKPLLGPLALALFLRITEQVTDTLMYAGSRQREMELERRSSSGACTSKGNLVESYTAWGPLIFSSPLLVALLFWLLLACPGDVMSKARRPNPAVETDRGERRVRGSDSLSGSALFV